ncbi:MAG: VPDSG-CTERM sorting domain-containing protein [Chthoniobacterales bacterium]
MFVAFASPAGVPDGGSSGLLLVMGVSALLLCKARPALRTISGKGSLKK